MLEKHLAHGNHLDFIMTVATDENRGRTNPNRIKNAALNLILSDDDDIAFFAIDSCAVRMHMPESFSKITERLVRDNSLEVLFSMVSGTGVLGRRNLIERHIALKTLREIRRRIEVEIDNSDVLKNCDNFIAELSENKNSKEMK